MRGFLLPYEAFSKVKRLLKKLPELAGFAHGFLEIGAKASQFKK